MWSGDTVLDRPQAMASMTPEGGLIGTTADALVFMRALLAGGLFKRSTRSPACRRAGTASGCPVTGPRSWRRARPSSTAWALSASAAPAAERRPPLADVHRSHGASGSWLFWCRERDLYLAGTVDQTTAAAVPYRLLPKLVNRLVV